MKKIFYFAILGIVISHSSCKKTQHDPLPEPSAKTYYGKEVALGDGTVQTFAVVDKNKNLQTLGVTLTKSALTNLPAMSGMQMGYSYSLPLPEGLEVKPFTHVMFDWNPMGHEPAGIYDKPHFDIHFYTIAEAEQNKIQLNDSLGELLPPPSSFPKDYIPLPGSVPMMGKHWVDSTAGELRGIPFTQTFLYGSFNKNFIFYEPMITLAYLQGKPNVSYALKPIGTSALPKGYNPTTYAIKFIEQEQKYTITLDGMKHTN